VSDINPATDSQADEPAASDPAEQDPAAGVEQAIDELDALLGGASFEDPAPGESTPPAARSAPAATPPSTPPAPAPGTAAVDLPAFDRVLQEAQVSGLDLLRDVNLDVKIELGRTRMLVEDVLKLVEGSVVELDKLAGDPVDVFVNERLVARGEVLVLNENFCVRINEIIQAVPEEDL
jgi:flagellar motor switch protein FliN/FliY